MRQHSEPDRSPRNWVPLQNRFRYALGWRWLQKYYIGLPTSYLLTIGQFVVHCSRTSTNDTCLNNCINRFELYINNHKCKPAFTIISALTFLSGTGIRFSYLSWTNAKNKQKKHRIIVLFVAVVVCACVFFISCSTATHLQWYLRNRTDKYSIEYKNTTVICLIVSSHLSTYNI